MKCVFFLLTAIALLCFACSAPSDTETPGEAISSEVVFSLPEVLKPTVDFWEQVFIKYDVDDVLIHNEEQPSIIYEVVKLPRDKTGEPVSGRTKHVFIQKALNKYKTAFHNLDLHDSGKLAKLSDTDAELRERLKTYGITSHYASLGATLRTQQGLRSRFIEGYINSGRYLPYIKTIFKQEGIPLEFCYLPHVESSFNHRAVSKSGAVGIWQLMPYSARPFVRVGYDVDERRDPLMATYAAAQYLKNAYEELGSWELALISYNHGVPGIKNAVARLKTTDLATIITLYQGRQFGFASRNFYTEFYAVKMICEQSEKYLAGVTKAGPMAFDVLVLPHYVDWRTVTHDLGLSDGTLRELNPHVKSSITDGRHRLSKGFRLRLPQGMLESTLAKYQSLPSAKLHTAQIAYQSYRVRKGDSLIKIARKYGTSVNAIKNLNSLRGSRIYVNQVLRVPNDGRRTTRQADREGDTKEIPHDQPLLPIEQFDPEFLESSASST